jgi:hypothetical protein
MRLLSWLSQILDQPARTPVISKYPLKTSRQLTMKAGTNEVALWAPQLYIVPFAKLPCSITRAQRIHFLIHLQPQDQDPTTYTITFPESPSTLGPGGAFLSHYA